MACGTLISEYRRLFNGNLIENRSTYLNDVDQMAAIQLSVLFLQKELHTNDTLSPEQLFELQRKIFERKLGVLGPDDVPQCNDNELIPLDDVYKSYVSFTKHCNMIDNADVKMITKSQIKDAEDKENDQNSSKDGSNSVNNLLSPPCLKPQATPVRSTLSAPSKSPSNLKTPLRSLVPPFSPFPSSPKDPSDIQLKRVIISYMQLIVNSRNEIALARVIDLPTRGIDRTSFTDIRNVALEKRMPMYQVISSFVRQCILGGKGYAPSEDHTLFKHKEGLMEFIDLMDKLQTIVDEGVNIHSLLSVFLKTLKVAFVRAKEPVFSAKSVSVVIQELQTVAKTKFKVSSEVGGRDMPLLLRDFIDLVSCLAGNEVSLHSSQLCGILSTPEVSSTTYRKINTLVTSFKTPQPFGETPIKGANSGDITKLGDVTPCGKDNSTTPVTGEGKDDADEEEESGGDGEVPGKGDAPVKLIRCKISVESQEEVTKKTNIFTKKKNGNEKPSSRKNSSASAVTAASTSTTEHPTTKRRPAPSKPKSKCAKKIKLVSGQKKLSQFFTK